MHNTLQPYSNFSGTARWRSRRIYLVGALGTIIEWYDFALYACFAHIFAVVFFANQSNAILMVYAIFFVSYLVRPLGGLIFGFIGDCWGRKPALLLSIIVISVSMFAMMVLPTWKMKGSDMPVLLIFLRVIQGLAVGGETAGALVYVLESVENKRQGFYGSVIFSMATFGTLLATIIVVVFMYTLNHGQLLAWGWRAAYGLGGLAGLIVLILRMHIS